MIRNQTMSDCLPKEINQELFWKIIEICSRISLFFSSSDMSTIDFPKILILPFKQASRDFVRVLKILTAHNHLSILILFKINIQLNIFNLNLYSIKL